MLHISVECKYIYTVTIIIFSLLLEPRKVLLGTYLHVSYTYKTWECKKERRVRFTVTVVTDASVESCPLPPSGGSSGAAGEVHGSARRLLALPWTDGSRRHPHAVGDLGLCGRGRLAAGVRSGRGLPSDGQVHGFLLLFGLIATARGLRSLDAWRL